MPSPESPRQPPAPEQKDLDGFVLVFAGSSEEDVSHARRLWSTLSLVPPRESRLVSADISQRLPVSRPQRSGNAASAPKTPRAAAAAPEPPSPQELQQRQEEKQLYLNRALQRREIMALLRRQRERRARRELQPQRVPEPKTPSPTPEAKLDMELVKQLG